MVESRKPIKVNEAITRMMNFAKEGSVEYIPIEKSYGRFLGEDLIADHHVPPFDRSPYDGFAVRAMDTDHASSNSPVELKIVGEVGAGSVFERPVAEGEVVRIMTGAQIPNGCNAVFMLEEVNESEKNGKKYIQIKRSVKSGKNISFTGEDTKKGTILTKKGIYITPGVVALLATFGYKKVPVAKKPIIGIIATGSELLEVDEALEPGKIRNSNAYMIQSQITRAGGKALYLGQLSDDFEVCYKQVKDAIDEVDMLITTGGVSVGDYDYLPDIYAKLDCNVLFNKIKMRPGSVTTVAEKNGKLLFGLSGNPSSCYVGFELYTRPAVRKFLHNSHPFLKKEMAQLGADFLKTNPFDRFIRGHMSYQNGRLVANSVGLDKPNVVSSLAKANILIMLPGGTRGYETGMDIPVILLEDQEGMAMEQFFDRDVNSRKG